jgi:hypothetical protein
MSIYPPPPAGWDASSPPSAAPASADEALRAWARERGHELNLAPDVAWFRGWAPFVYLPTPAKALRELRATVGDAQAFIAMIEEEPAAAPGARGGATSIVSFLTAPSLTHRAAMRSRLQVEAVEELRGPMNLRRTPRPTGNWRMREKDRFMRRTYGRSVKGALGDAIFEAHFEITTPSREEGILAFPMTLRQQLVGIAFRGVIEVRPGGMIVERFGPPSFTPSALDETLGQLGALYGTMRAGDPITPPPSSYPVAGKP